MTSLKDRASASPAPAMLAMIMTRTTHPFKGPCGPAFARRFMFTFRPRGSRAADDRPGHSTGSPYPWGPVVPSKGAARRAHGKRSAAHRRAGSTAVSTRRADRADCGGRALSEGPYRTGRGRKGPIGGVLSEGRGRRAVVGGAWSEGRRGRRPGHASDGIRSSGPTAQTVCRVSGNWSSSAWMSSSVTRW